MKYSVYAYGTLDDCPHLTGVKMSSLYCTQDCEYCSNKIYKDDINSFTCNFIKFKRKEKIKKLIEYNDR